MAKEQEMRCWQVVSTGARAGSGGSGDGGWLGSTIDFCFMETEPKIVSPVAANTSMCYCHKLKRSKGSRETDEWGSFT